MDLTEPREMGPDRAVRVGAWRPDGGEFEDRVTAESPLEIRVNGEPVAVTLRTPGDDEELAAGFVFTEGIAAGAEQILDVRVVREASPASDGRIVDVRLASPGSGLGHRGQPQSRGLRTRLITAAGLTGGPGTVEAVRRRIDPLADSWAVPGCRLAQLSDRLRAAQEVFAVTGGVHAAGLFDADGGLLVAREDIGRHNAVDKVVGWGLANRRLPFARSILLVSGRAGFDILVKAWTAGVPIVASISAPSDLAIRLAEEANVTLVGFLRGDRYSVYAGRRRLLAS